MLCEALGSIQGADQLIVTDDGSDFDVRSLVGDCCPWASFVMNDPIPTAQRLKAARVGSLVNRALAMVACDVVTYLCDDDLFHPYWLYNVRTFFDANPEQHWTRGAWFAFDDADPERAQTRCKLDPRQLTTGNFAHKIACFRDEHIAWDETTIASHDNAFLWNAAKHHDMRLIPFCGAVAGWRRLHKHNALHYAVQDGYSRDAHQLFAGGYLE